MGGRPIRDRIDEQIEGLGPAIRRVRRERGLTLEEVAVEVGSSVAHLSRLESGTRQPSLGGLLRVAAALGVEIGELFDVSEEPGPGTVVRGVEAPFYENKALRFQPLMPEAGPEGLTAVRVVFPADRVDTEHHDHEHGGQEWLYMLKGRLRLTLGNDRTVLEPGDAAFFDARLRHRFDVFSEEDAEILMVSCVPCTHGGGPPGRPHPFEETNRGPG